MELKAGNMTIRLLAGFTLLLVAVTILWGFGVVNLSFMSPYIIAGSVTLFAGMIYLAEIWLEGKRPDITKDRLAQLGTIISVIAVIFGFLILWGQNFTQFMKGLYSFVMVLLFIGLLAELIWD